MLIGLDYAKNVLYHSIGKWKENYRNGMYSVENNGGAAKQTKNELS